MFRKRRRGQFGDLKFCSIHELIPDPSVYENTAALRDLELLSSIKREGVHEPILARRRGHEFLVFDGAQRVACCQELHTVFPSLERIPVRILENINDDEARLFHRFANAYTQNVLPSAQREILGECRDSLAVLRVRHPEWPPESLMDSFLFATYFIDKSRTFLFYDSMIEDKLPTLLKTYLDKGWLARRDAANIALWPKAKVRPLVKRLDKSKPNTKSEFLKFLQDAAPTEPGSTCGYSSFIVP